MTSDRLDLTRGSISGQLFRLSMPIMFGMLMFMLYMISDLFFVSRLGPDAVAALSISGNVFFIHLGLSFVIGTGAMSLIARYFGGDRKEKAGQIFKQSLLLSLFSGLVVALAGIVLSKPYIRFFGGTGMAYTWGVEYFRVYSVSLLFLLLLHVSGACYRGMGDTKTSMKITFQSLIINIILDPVLIFGIGFIPAMGVKGAAIASLISQIYGVVIYLYLIFHKQLHIKLQGPWTPDFSLMKKSLAIGLPSGMAYFLLTLNMLITYKVISRFGTPAIASVGIGFRVIQAVYLPTVAVADAMAAMVGQNLGAGNFARIKTSFWKGWQISCVLMLTGTVICWLFPEMFIGFFGREPELIQFGVVYLSIVSLSNLPVGTILTVSAVFQGIGRTLPSLFAALVDNLLFASLVLTLPMVFGWGFSSVWWIKFVTALVETTILSLWLWRMMKRFQE